MITGILPKGLSFMNSGLNCSSLPRSTFFTLYVIPTMYSLIGKNVQRIDSVEIELNKQLKK